MSRRVGHGTYWADANSHVPWCKKCEDKTPEGPGVEQPVEAPHVDDYQLTTGEQQQVAAWAQGIVKRRYPDFDMDFVNPEDPQADKATELFQVAVTAIHASLAAHRGDLTRDQAEALAEEAIKKHVDEETRSLKSSSGHMNLSDRPPEE